MIKNTIFIFTLLLSFSSFAQKPLRLLTAEYCPLICKDEKHKGFAVDLTHEIARIAGYKLEVFITSLDRAFFELKNTESYDGIIMGSKEHIPNTIFLEKPIFSQAAVIYSRKKLNWSYKNIQSLEGFRIAAIKNFVYSDGEIDNYLKNSKNVSLLFHSDSLSKMINRLNLNRIDLFFAGEKVAKYHLKKMKLENEFRKSKKILNSYDNYISISKHVKKKFEIKKALDLAYKKFVKSKDYKKLLLKYELD